MSVIVMKVTAVAYAAQSEGHKKQIMTGEVKETFADDIQYIKIKEEDDNEGI